MKKNFVVGICLALVCSNAFAWRVLTTKDDGYDVIYTIHCDNGNLETISQVRNGYFVTNRGIFNSLHQAATKLCGE